MTELFLSIEGTAAAGLVAALLALCSAVAHAVFGALQKGRFDPWLTRGAIDIFYFLIALPIALFVFPWPEGNQWWLLAGAWFIHVFYKLFQAMAYTRGAYTVVYPVVRGTGPLVTVIVAGAIFDEHFTLVQWLGVLLLSGGIFLLAGWNLRKVTVGRETLVAALGLAFVTGILVALYTTFDAYGMRSTPNPFTFLFWFFVVDGWVFPILAFFRYRNMAFPPPLAPLMQRGFIGSLIAFFSFGAVMLATRLDQVGQAAVLRETSTVFAALIGWLFLKETVGPVRAILMAAIAFGAVVVEFGG